MLKAAIDRILSLAGPHIAEINGETYADRPLERIPHERRASPIEVHTLTSILDYITSGADECAEDENSIGRRFVIHVADHQHVYLYRELNQDKARECLLECSVSPASYPFSRWLDIESFIIAMQAHFVPSENVDALVKLMGNVVDENSVTTTDDGVTQEATVRKGVMLVGRERVPNPVELAPFRTFHEIEQPESTFVFRVRKGSDGVQAALFTADGNAWVNDAILGIRDYLFAELPEEMRDDVIILA